MALEVIGAGFGRTGTNSLKLALERLGFGPCHHMFEVRDNPEQLPAWEAAARAEPVVIGTRCSMLRARKRKGFGWKRWSRRWLGNPCQSFRRAD